VELTPRARLDVLLVERGLLESRTKARAAIEAGRVWVDGEQALRPAMLVEYSAEILAEPAHPWVSRAALKLCHALRIWPIPVEGRTVLDVGASTGGFTEVCLASGAGQVYAVDVGRGQLHARIAANPRVVDLQGTDARVLDHRLLPETPELVVCDASFISLTKVLPVPLSLTTADADLVALVKPQFEVGPNAVGKRGVVRDHAARMRALDEIRTFLERSGWSVNDAAESPIRGATGNHEYLVWARRSFEP
jgi:23S rRNA (cytidine1920-2'-O)/16S rRNA (cytidine1409-2'-O)-methyltransferase